MKFNIIVFKYDYLEDFGIIINKRKKYDKCKS